MGKGTNRKYHNVDLAWKTNLGQRDKIETSENNEPLPWAYD